MRKCFTDRALESKVREACAGGSSTTSPIPPLPGPHCNSLNRRPAPNRHTSRVGTNDPRHGPGFAIQFHADLTPHRSGARLHRARTPTDIVKLEWGWTGHTQRSRSFVRRSHAVAIFGAPRATTRGEGQADDHRAAYLRATSWSKCSYSAAAFRGAPLAVSWMKTPKRNRNGLPGSRGSLPAAPRFAFFPNELATSRP